MLDLISANKIFPAFSKMLARLEQSMISLLYSGTDKRQSDCLLYWLAILADRLITLNE